MKFSSGLILFLFCFCACTGLKAQEVPVADEDSDMTDQVQMNDRYLNDMFNRQSPSEALQAGGAFYVSNPPPSIELDPKKAYYRTEWDTLVIRMMTGNTVELTGRYRIFDQKFEVKTNGGIYEMSNSAIAEVQLGSDYFKVLKTYVGEDIIQVYCKTPEYSFAGMHSVELEDPKTKNMFDTSEDVVKLKRKNTLMLITADNLRVPLKNKKQVLLMLGVYKGSPAMQYLKKQKLDMAVPADVVELIQFIESEKLKNN